jgi:L-malate glycosyltransferase
MKLLILSDANSIHTQKWVLSLSGKGINVRLFSLFKPSDQIEKKYHALGVKIDSSNLNYKILNNRKPNFSKILYLTSLPKLKKTIKSFSPQIIHAHYASSYGTLAYLTKFKPTILSIWGSDIYDFPKKNILNKWILNKVINSMNCICSTSNAMIDILKTDYNRKDVNLIPFGVNTNKFTPQINNNKIFTVGTIKSIESHNGIDCIIDAAKILIHDKKFKDIKFLIVGEGTLLKDMQNKCNKLKLNENIKFSGQISHDKIVEYFNKLSVFVAVSTRESFGVSILEAASCQIPAITSNVGGLPEVNKNNYTGFIIPPNNPHLLSEKILKLYNEKNILNEMGINARKRVVKSFNWNTNLEKMINLYKNYI